MKIQLLASVYQYESVKEFSDYHFEEFMSWMEKHPEIIDPNSDDSVGDFAARLIPYDPTDDKRYFEWIALNILTGKSNWEDLERLKREDGKLVLGFLLKQQDLPFDGDDQYVIRVRTDDLEAAAKRPLFFKALTFSGLEAIVEAAAPQKVAIDTNNRFPDEHMLTLFSDKPYGNLLHLSEDFRIVEVLTEEAAEFWGKLWVKTPRGSWCTGYGHWDSYKGFHLVVVIDYNRTIVPAETKESKELALAKSKFQIGIPKKDNNRGDLTHVHDELDDDGGEMEVKDYEDLEVPVTALNKYKLLNAMSIANSLPLSSKETMVAAIERYNKSGGTVKLSFKDLFFVNNCLDGVTERTLSVIDSNQKDYWKKKIVNYDELSNETKAVLHAIYNKSNLISELVYHLRDKIDLEAIYSNYAVLEDVLKAFRNFLPPEDFIKLGFGSDHILSFIAKQDPKKLFQLDWGALNPRETRAEMVEHNIGVYAANISCYYLESLIKNKEHEKAAEIFNNMYDAGELQQVLCSSNKKELDTWLKVIHAAKAKLLKFSQVNIIKEAVKDLYPDIKDDGVTNNLFYYWFLLFTNKDKKLGREDNASLSKITKLSQGDFVKLLSNALVKNRHRAGEKETVSKNGRHLLNTLLDFSRHRSILSQDIVEAYPITEKTIENLLEHVTMREHELTKYYNFFSQLKEYMEKHPHLIGKILEKLSEKSHLYQEGGEEKEYDNHQLLEVPYLVVKKKMENTPDMVINSEKHYVRVMDELKEFFAQNPQLIPKQQVTSIVSKTLFGGKDDANWLIKDRVKAAALSRIEEIKNSFSDEQRQSLALFKCSNLLLGKGQKRRGNNDTTVEIKLGDTAIALISPTDKTEEDDWLRDTYKTLSEQDKNTIINKFGDNLDIMFLSLLSSKDDGTLPPVRFSGEGNYTIRNSELSVTFTYHRLNQAILYIENSPDLDLEDLLSFGFTIETVSPLNSSSVLAVEAFGNNNEAASAFGVFFKTVLKKALSKLTKVEEKRRLFTLVGIYATIASGEDYKIHVKKIMNFIKTGRKEGELIGIGKNVKTASNEDFKITINKVASVYKQIKDLDDELPNSYINPTASSLAQKKPCLLLDLVMCATALKYQKSKDLSIANRLDYVKAAGSLDAFPSISEVLDKFIIPSDSWDFDRLFTSSLNVVKGLSDINLLDMTRHSSLSRLVDHAKKALENF